MRLFRRRRGRHALGAAVTAIPSTPIAAAAPLPPWEVTAPPALSVVMTPVAPEVASEIAQLIASGEAWRSTCGDRPSATTLVESPPVQDGPVPRPPSVSTVPAPFAHAHVSVPMQSAGALQEPQATRSELSVVPSEAALEEVPAPRRVQLGFRDGTSTVLDPASMQAQALEQLARSLTRRD